MPAWLLWLLPLIEKLGLPALKALVVFILQLLEKAWPGIAPLVDAIIAFIQGGGSARQLHEHLASTVEGFPAAPPVAKA